jgi:hypothetical protein
LFSAQNSSFETLLRMLFLGPETALSSTIAAALEGQVVRGKIARPGAPQGSPTNNQSLTPSLTDLHHVSMTCEDPNVLLQFVSAKSALKAFGFQQHAGDVVVLRSVADEQIDFGHQALEHFRGLDRFAGFDRGQQTRLAVVFLAGVFGFH